MYSKNVSSCIFNEYFSYTWTKTVCFVTTHCNDIFCTWRRSPSEHWAMINQLPLPWSLWNTEWASNWMVTTNVNNNHWDWWLHLDQLTVLHPWNWKYSDKKRYIWSHRDCSESVTCKAKVPQEDCLCQCRRTERRHSRSKKSASPALQCCRTCQYQVILVFRLYNLPLLCFHHLRYLDIHRPIIPPGYDAHL